VASNKVLLACNKPTKFTDLTYPMFASPKYDGNRLVIRYGELLSRKMKPQPNRYLPKFLKAICDYSSANRIVFDGEFFSQDVHFTDIQSMRAHDWKPPEHFAYHVFDMLDEYRCSDRGREEDGSITRTSSKSTRELVPDCIGATQVRLDDGTTCNVCLKRGVSYEALGITWKNRKKFIGRYVEIEYQECGTKDRPRLGRIIRLRPDLDE
jgi:hypothetical protein